MTVRITRILLLSSFAGLDGADLSIVGAGVRIHGDRDRDANQPKAATNCARGAPVWPSIAKVLKPAGLNVSADLINMLPFVAIIVSLLVCRRSYRPPVLPLPYALGAR